MSDPIHGEAVERPPLRIGLLVDSFDQPAWVRRMLERVLDSPHAEVALIIKNDEAGDTGGRNGGRLAAYWRSRSHLLFAFYQRLDRRRSLGGPDAFAKTDTADLLTGVPVVDVSPRRTKFSDFLSDEEIAEIEGHDLDVLVRLGFRILRGGVLGAAKHGVWSFHHGDNRVNRGGPAGFWEVLLGWPRTGSILQILNEDLDGGYVLARSWASTNPFSVRANKNSYYWKSLSMLPRKLEQLHRDGPESFFAEHDGLQDPAGFYSNRLFLMPTNRELAGPFLRVHTNLLKRKLAQLFGFEQWELRYELREGFGSSLWRMKRLVPPPDRFWADPHVIRRDGRFYVFLEELLYETRKGHISVLTIDDDGRVSDPRPVLERPYHLSYPFLFEHGGELYMIPETSGARTVELYRCDRFPGEWSFVRVLMEDITAVDATLIEHGDRWWMFASVREEEGGPFDDELFVFHTDDPVSGAWTPHARNPVVSDVSRARPAGAFVQTEHGLLRPSQDGAPGYGWGVRLHRVDELTPEVYRETEVAAMEPAFAPEARAVHSVAHVPGLTVIDARVRRRSRRG